MWVTGYLARHLRIRHRDLAQFWTMQAAQLLLYKSIQAPQHTLRILFVIKPNIMTGIQSPDIYCPDYLAGPMDRDKSLSLALARRARWCYKHHCYNNIYSWHDHPRPTNVKQTLNAKVIKRFFPFH